MRSILTAAALAAMPASLFAAPVSSSSAGPVPQGLLPDTAKPVAYRLDLTVLPDQERFSGHAEIDVTLKAPTRSLYLHARDLKVASALARAAGPDPAQVVLVSRNQRTVTGSFPEDADWPQP